MMDTGMVARVSKSKFKAKALELFRQVETSGEVIVITDHGEPTLEVRRYQQPRRDPLAVLKGSVLRYERPTDPVADDDWEAAN
jgi:antitoxin (DNA-binding transcriptional repressor) of toxin-antitoxin stability system